MKRVLIIDSHPDSAEGLAQLVAYWGYEAHFAVDGPAGVAQALVVEPQVIVTELRLSRLDGLELCRRLKEKPQFEGTSFVAVAGDVDHTLRARAGKVGYAYVMRKPVEPDALQRLLSELLQ